MRSLVAQIKAQLPLSSVVREYVRLTRKGKDFWGVCPFHKESSPSFVVHDDTGRYHCFGCGAGGDSISFISDIGNLSFKDAVETLALKCGLQLPEDFSTSTSHRPSHTPLYDILSQAALWFEGNLKQPGGAECRNYLHSRTIDPQAQRWFQMGWAPGTSQGGTFLMQHFTRTGRQLSLLQEAGLVFPSERTLPPRDRFRGRLMFPIHDRRGRVVGFGGRTLGDGEPKYLNSPETAVFEKRQHLYGLWQSLKNKDLRDKPVVIAEGYLDVIALHTSGLARGVAPLGTAIGESQLLLAWGLSSAPIVCFDGDLAGQNAALKTALQALALLKPGFSLMFCPLPGDADPQSLIAQGDTGTLARLLHTPLALSEYLWQDLIKKFSLKTPESQAMFRKTYREYCQTIQDGDMRKLYEKTFDTQFYETLRQAPRGRTDHTHGKATGFGGKSPRPTPKLTPPPAPVLTPSHTHLLQVHILLLTARNHPELLLEFQDSLAALSLPLSLVPLQRALVEWAEMRTDPGMGDVATKEGAGNDLDLSPEKGILEELDIFLTQRELGDPGGGGIDPGRVFQHAAFAHQEVSFMEARRGFCDVLECYQREWGLKRELDEAQMMFSTNPREQSWTRLKKLRELYDIKDIKD